MNERAILQDGPLAGFSFRPEPNQFVFTFEGAHYVKLVREGWVYRENHG